LEAGHIIDHGHHHKTVSRPMLISLRLIVNN